jgi:hypothetical protein
VPIGFFGCDLLEAAGRPVRVIQDQDVNVAECLNRSAEQKFRSFRFLQIDVQVFNSSAIRTQFFYQGTGFPRIHSPRLCSIKGVKRMKKEVSTHRRKALRDRKSDSSASARARDYSYPAFENIAGHGNF